MSDISNIIDLMVGKFADTSGSNSDARTALNSLFATVYCLDKVDVDATNSSTTAATASAPAAVRFDGQVKQAFLSAPVAITADATNNATITVKAYPAAGVTGVTIATYITTTAVTAFARTAMTLATTGANLALVAGSNISIEVSKGGTGITLPPIAVQIFVEPT